MVSKLMANAAAETRLLLRPSYQRTVKTIIPFQFTKEITLSVDRDETVLQKTFSFLGIAGCAD